MSRSRIDTSLVRVEKAGFAYPLGAYPVEEFTPVPGCAVEFEAADGADEEGEWEEWPDRYVFDIVVTATRLEALCRSLFALFPGRVYPILDVLGHDAYRDVDPYIAYDLVGLDRFMDSVRRHRGWFFEDGLVGFGAMSLEPFIYVFVDEHKVVTVRVQTDLRERIERIVGAFDLPVLEEPQALDSAAHEHRCVLDAPPERTDLLTAEEILEELIDDWRLRLNIDRFTNVDDRGADLGVTGWRCLLRAEGEPDGPSRYAEALVRASCHDEAEWLALEAIGGERDRRIAPEGADLDDDDDGDDEDDDPALVYPELFLLVADRLTPEEYGEALTEFRASTGESTGAPPAPPPMDESGLDIVRWLTS